MSRKGKPNKFPTRLWTPEEDHKLLMALGDHTIAMLMRALPGRSEEAIRIRLKRTHRISALTGVMTLNEFARHSGFDYKTLMRAKRELKQVWPRFNLSHARNKRGRIYVISDNQQEALLKHLIHGYQPAGTPCEGASDAHGRSTEGTDQAGSEW